ncbi:COG4315 family predicted lipoprotein [Mangrovihabitans endophyticus]|uniref:Lipoprotein with Yx(FWY)xxD motif n=1 Tax=Mangrovihabitans endophyticus TaxID=1751298 RepID=A0A8J3C1S9_9ACTN|nr:hypothetical protein [Mangrovihabitans endophyticus]GGL06323.1 hypothetical protein GCM10012284_45740 [Mangrovihabitans endophyticus]
MVPDKRLVVSGAAVAAAFALAACAPAGYNAADYGGAAQPAANAVAATPTATASAGAEADAGSEEAGSETVEVPTDEVTTQLTAAKVKRMGETVQNQDGFVLYRFDDDKTKPEVVSNCNDDCEKVWPPVRVNDELPELDGVDPADVGTVTREDGTKQVTVGKWPVYTYIGDKQPGKWTGQNVAGKWFVVTPDGTKNLTCLPKKSKAVAPPADDSDSSSDGGDDSGSDYSY